VDAGGNEALGAYLTEHPDSARRIQGEMKSMSMLGREASPPKARTEPASQELKDKKPVTVEALNRVIHQSSISSLHHVTSGVA